MVDDALLESFASASFSVESWLDAKLSGAEEGNSDQLLETAEGLLGSLRAANRALEVAWQSQVQACTDFMPSLCADLALAEQCSLDLSNQLKLMPSVSGRSDSGGAAAAAGVVDSLIRRHRSKVALDALTKCLQQMRLWKELVDQTEPIFGTADCAAISGHIDRMQQCLQWLRDLADPDLAAKAGYLDDVKNQFIGVVSPSLIGAFAKRNADQLGYFASLFQALSRQSDLDNLFAEYIKQQLTSAWHNASSVAVVDGLRLPSEVFKQLHQVVVDVWLSEVDGLCDLLTVRQQAVVDCLCVGLDCLEPSVTSMLTDHINCSPAECLQDGVVCKERLEMVIDRLDARFSLASSDCRRLLAERLAAFLLPLLSRYQRDESSYLLEQCSKLQSDSLTWSLVVQHMLHVDQVFALIQESLRRASTMFGPFGLPMVCKAVDMLLVNYVADANRTLGKLFQVDDVSSTTDCSSASSSSKRISRLLAVIHFVGKLITSVTKLLESVLVVADQLKQKVEADRQSWTPFDQAIGGGPTLAACQNFLNAMAGRQPAVGATLPAFWAAWRTGHRELIKLSFQALFKPIDRLLSGLAEMTVWQKQMAGGLQADLPSYGFMAQEYITFLGQYLITLAHDLEPLLCDSAATDFNVAFRGCSLPYSTAADAGQLVVGDGQQQQQSAAAARLLLHCCCRGAAVNFVQRIQAVVPSMSKYGRKQLLADAEYLCNLLDDLAVDIPDQLTSLLADNGAKLGEPARRGK